MTKNFLNIKEIEEKWQRKWQESKIFEPNPDNRKSFFVTVAFPYPSGSMHVGHARTYTVPDIYARFKRMQGYNVLFPMAWHVTGTPVVGVAKRIEKGDEKTIKIYRDLYKVPEETLRKFVDPYEIVRYFSNEYKHNMRKMGYSIDWRREFTTVDRHYNKFIEWQYRLLKSKNLVFKAKHPVRFCPSCNNPVGDHDLLEGEQAFIHEFTLIKFEFNDAYLPCATLRPETIFGVTNLWINPNASYVLAKVNDEKWIISKQAAEKLKYQDCEVEIVKEIDAKELIGKKVKAPLVNRQVIILPASFVDPDYATGVVMSVPAHAPYDYVALMELKRNPQIVAHAIRPYELEKIEPIVIIHVDGKAICEKMVKEAKIEGQNDERLEDVTAKVYAQEYAKGKMLNNTPHANKSVKEARELVKDDLAKVNRFAKMYDFSERPVICRCGTACIVKIIKDQWFLRYSFPEWKERVKECLQSMDIVPNEIKADFMHVVDWLKDWACARKVGLGTKLPWDKEWIVEPLSDSVIYMAYYTIAHKIKEVDASKLNDDVFNYIFLGIGNASEIAEKQGISRELLESMRREFLYWYPCIYRFSAKDLVGNHLTFYIYHHVAIFSKQHWPKGIVVFGMGLLEGKKMSSSKGNVIILQDAIERHGADVIRFFLASSAEPWQDFDWREKLVNNCRNQLVKFFKFVEEHYVEGESENEYVDRWFENEINEIIDETTRYLEHFQIRKALQNAFYRFFESFEWYIRRGGKKLCKKAIETWLKLLTPFIPHICEELWQKIGKETFISLESWPVAKETNEKIKISEEIIKGILDDIEEIIKLSKERPSKIYIYIAEPWKYDAYTKAIKMIDEGKAPKEVVGMLIKEFKKDFKVIRKIVDGYIDKGIRALSYEEEKRIIGASVKFFERELNAKVVIEFAEKTSYDPLNKARQALPGKPAIYIE